MNDSELDRIITGWLDPGSGKVSGVEYGTHEKRPDNRDVAIKIQDIYRDLQSANIAHCERIQELEGLILNRHKHACTEAWTARGLHSPDCPLDDLGHGDPLREAGPGGGVMSEKKTVRVKIAVAVDCDGRWCASGWGSENLMNSDHGDIIDDLAPGENQFWLYADLPVPEIQDVEATVEDA